MTNRLITDHLSKKEKRKLIANIEDGKKSKSSKRTRFIEQVTDPNLVGTLNLKTRKNEKNIEITLDSTFWIGRDPSCDLVIDDPRVSQRHLRLYAVRTTTELSLAILHDTSTNGYLLNKERCGLITKKIGEKEINTRNRVLREGDVIEITGYDGIFTYSQHSQAMAMAPATQSLPGSLRLFSSADPSLTLYKRPWVIHNYPLGNGSWGIVNIGSHHRASEIQVAIKTIKQNKRESQHVEKIKYEIQVQKSLDHPNILKLLDYMIGKKHHKNSRNSREHIEVAEEEGEETNDDEEEHERQEEEEEEGDKIHMILELVTGGDLWSYLEKHRQLREDEVRWIGWQMISGIKYLHEKGIVHRDVKPENILLKTSCAYPRIILGDFGCSTSKAIVYSHLSDGGSTEHSKHYNRQGTTEYFPYDYLKGMREEEKNQCLHVYNAEKKEIGKKWWKEEMGMDMWATGITLYFCAAYNLPYRDIPDLQEYQALSDIIITNTSTAKSPKNPVFGEINQDIFLQPEVEESMAEVDLLVADPICDFPSQESVNLPNDQEDENESDIDEDDADDNDSDLDLFDSQLNDQLGGLILESQAVNEKRGRKNSNSIINIRSDTPSSRRYTAVPRNNSPVSAISQYDDIIHGIENFKALGLDNWGERYIWPQWSKEGKRFIDKLLELDPEKRIQSHKAHDHLWFSKNEKELSEIYDKVLIKGEVIEWLL
ncbi:uncharacterized protein L201_001482 [Kwoniella dendrophila CBS 6074]|uniref:non-specific serine/threonine protein kinase n=1 Tax=Kwoniella dendrophila CBS 6074 TaxID=1295534 RepID=A0AAX4JMG3_9TREE